MKQKNILKKPTAVKESLFIKSFRLAKSNPNKTGYMILFDLLFLGSLYVLQFLSQYFAQSLAIAQSLASALVFIVYSLIYYLIALFFYSFFKYINLDFIKSLFENTEFSFKKLGQFYSLNILIAGIFFAAMILANLLLASTKVQYRPFVFIVLAVPYLLFLYAVINIAHSLFYEGSSIKESAKKSFKIAFTKMKIYRETVLIMILFALLLWLLFLGSGYVVRLLTSKNYSLYLNAYAYFKQISIVVVDAVSYLAILLNRISFYGIIRNSD